MEQTDLLKYAVDALERLGIRYAIVGAFASGVWGESRFTQDVDILIELPTDRVTELCDAFPHQDFYINAAAANEACARRSQFNVVHPVSGNKIDFMIADQTAWKSAQLDRHKLVQILPGLNAAVAAPEDVIIGKLVYFREGGSDKHLRDITGILEFSGAIVDQTYVTDIAWQLGVAEIWQSILDRIQTA